ncbi:MAG: hypothetical protein AB7S68_05915 [Polyangiaceae bacterium]
MPQEAVRALDRLGNSRNFYSGNLDMRRKLIGNAFINSAQLQFDVGVGVRLITDPTGSDLVSLGWNPGRFGGTATATRTGFSPAPLQLPGFSGSSLEFPGMLMRFTTTPPLLDSFSGVPSSGTNSGFRMIAIGATTGTTATTATQVLEPYDRVTGLLAEGDDAVTVRLAPAPGNETLAFWLDPPADPADRSIIFAYARCGTAPTPASFDKIYSLFDEPVGATRKSAKQLIQLPPCRSSWFFTVRNNSSTAGDRVFHLHYSTHRTLYGGINVGVAFNANPDELAAIRKTLTQSAWLFYARTGGAYLIHSYRLFNNATYCDDHLSSNDIACDGQNCDVCFDDEAGGRSTYTTLSRIVNIRRDHWSPELVSHEFGHWLLNFRDEYHSTDACGTGSVSVCTHGAMRNRSGQKHRFCTDFDHMLEPEDQRRLPGRSRTVSLIPGCGFSCDGARHCCDTSNVCNSKSSLHHAFDDHLVPVLHPQDRSVEGTDYLNIFASSSIAASDPSADWNKLNRGYLGRFERLF